MSEDRATPAPPTDETEPGKRAPVSQRPGCVTALVVVGSLPMLLGLLDPLEGMFVVALGGILVLVAAFWRKSRARWPIIAGLAVLVLTFASMAAAGGGDVPRYLMPLTLGPWMLGGLLIIAGDIWLIRQVLAEKRPKAANIVAAVLVLLVVLAGVRIGMALGAYRPWEEVKMSVRATAEGRGVRLILMLEDAPRVDTEAAYYGAGVLQNASDAPLTLAPDTIIDVIVADASGKVTWDGAEKYYGRSKPVLPWDRPTTVAPGAQTKQSWELNYPQPGTYYVRAEVKNGPFAGLKTEPVTVTVSPPGAPY